MKKILWVLVLVWGIQALSMADCNTCSSGGGVYIDPVGGVGPTPTGGDDVPHGALVLYYYGSYYFNEPVAGVNKAQCEAALAQVTSNPNYSYVEVRRPCTPAY